MGNFIRRMLNFRTKLAAHPRIRRTLYSAIILLAGLLFLQSEIASRAGADTVAKYVRGITFSLDSGRSDSPAPPGSGPLDIRLGYTRIPAIVDSLERYGFRVEKQATVSSRFASLAERGFFPPYDERTQAGLTLLDHKGVLIAKTRFPAMVYDSVDAIPTPISQTLLFLENRELLDDRDPYQNPAIEWDRLVAAAANFAGARVLGSDQRFGASTLATQLEKLRHSRDGITRTPRDKAKQMVSATLRSYLHGPFTSDVRRRILLDYVNSLPLGAVPGYGEVIGVRDGFQRWFGLNPDSADWWLRTTGATPSTNAARAYRASMMLLLGQRRPSYYLQSEKGRAALDSLTQSHLRLVEQTGVVPASLAQAARNVRIELITTPIQPPRVAFIERKAINATRSRLSDLVDAPGLYELDRYDLTAHTTFDAAAQDSATTLIRSLADRDFIAANGLGAERLLGNADPGRVIYSLLLYERTPLGNAVRVQVDNLDRPFDLNQGARLELGSTAKLRTLVTYLEIVADLYASLTSTFADSSVDRRADDPISVWARDYLRDVPHSTLGSMLTAAMERRYSANSRESFFTGGGVLTFRNFDRTHENAMPTVTEGFRHSINLVFIRLMRDVVRYHMARNPDYTPTVLDNPDDPQRITILESYVNTEGRSAIERFARRHRGLSTDSSIAIILGRRATPHNWGRLIRAIDPAISDSALRASVGQRYPANVPDDAELARLGRAVPSTLTLGDRAYVTGTDPLELWVVGQFRLDPSRSIAQLQEDGGQARKEAYAWLFRQGASVKRAQDRAIQITLERDAFRPILAAWQRLGYPYANMVPSYGSSIGSSGDRPGALADLVSILVADGIRRPAVQLTALHFAQGTPYEVLLARDTAKADTVMSAEVAAVVRSAMQDVVQNGTAILLRDAVPGMPIGGKTGTGDNVARTYGAGGRLISTRTVSRTATFVFFLGDRFFGVSTAYVEGSDAESYNFTSGLPVRVVKLLLPSLAPLLGTDTLTTPTTNGSR